MRTFKLSVLPLILSSYVFVCSGGFDGIGQITGAQISFHLQEGNSWFLLYVNINLM